MQKIKILIADDNIEFAGLVKDYLAKAGDFYVVGVCYDGRQVIDYLADDNKEKPDVVLLDIIMPHYDGIAVLEYLHKNKSDKQSNENICFIMLTAVGQELFIKRALDLGASYFMLKPIELDVIARRIKDMAALPGQCHPASAESNHLMDDCDDIKNFLFNINIDSKEVNDEIAIELMISELLRRKKILPHFAGYQYLIYAVKKIIMDGNRCIPITKKLYPKIAEKFGSTPTKVERCIRTAIQCAWKGKEGKPSNFEFITEIAETVKKIHKTYCKNEKN